MLNINNKASRSINRNSDIENVLIDSYDKNNIISREKLQNNFNNINKDINNIKINKTKLPINLFKNKNSLYYPNLKLKAKSLPKYQTIKTTQIIFPINNSNNNNSNIKNKNKNNKKFKSFGTSTNFKTEIKNEEIKNTNNTSLDQNNFISKKNYKVCFGKSLNQILINNIKATIKNKGTTIQQIKSKKYSSIIYKPSYSNKNSDDIHKKIFEDKLVQIYDKYKKRQELYKKIRIDKLMSSYEKNKFENRNNIPLYIRGYNKKKLDIFYTRNICDLDYQRYYNKSQLNIEDILENHNKNNRKEYLSGNIPFYLLTKTLYKPMLRKSVSQRNTPIKFTQI